MDTSEAGSNQARPIHEKCYAKTLPEPDSSGIFFIELRSRIDAVQSDSGRTPEAVTDPMCGEHCKPLDVREFTVLVGNSLGTIEALRLV